MSNYVIVKAHSYYTAIFPFYKAHAPCSCACQLHISRKKIFKNNVDLTGKESFEITKPSIKQVIILENIDLY